MGVGEGETKNRIRKADRPAINHRESTRVSEFYFLRFLCFLWPIPLRYSGSLPAEIRRFEFGIGAEIGGRALQHHAPGLQHIRVVGNLQRELGVLFDE